METINVKMVRDKVLIEQLKGDSNVAGIEVAQTHIKKLKEGIVVACNESFIHGHTGVSEVIKCKVGDRVKYQQFGGSEVEYEGKPYIVLKYEDIQYIYQ